MSRAASDGEHCWISAARIADQPAVLDLGEPCERGIGDHRGVDGVAGDLETAAIGVVHRLDAREGREMRAHVAPGGVERLRLVPDELGHQGNRAIDVAARRRDAPRVAAGVGHAALRSGGVEERAEARRVLRRRGSTPNHPATRPPRPRGGRATRRPPRRSAIREDRPVPVRPAGRVRRPPTPPRACPSSAVARRRTTIHRHRRRARRRCRTTPTPDRETRRGSRSPGARSRCPEPRSPGRCWPRARERRRASARRATLRRNGTARPRVARADRASHARADRRGHGAMLVERARTSSGSRARRCARRRPPSRSHAG